MTRHQWNELSTTIQNNSFALAPSLVIQLRALSEAIAWLQSEIALTVEFAALVEDPTPVHVSSGIRGTVEEATVS